MLAHQQGSILNTADLDLHPTRKLIVYPGNESLHVTADVDALPLTTLARELAA